MVLSKRNGENRRIIDREFADLCDFRVEVVFELLLESVNPRV
jgi:hypothetical protein